MTDRYDNLDEYRWLELEVDRNEAWQALELGRTLNNVLKPNLILDIGCSSGIYLLPFRAFGCAVLGIDGASGVGKWLEHYQFRVVDLRKPWEPPFPYDLSLCIEVAEHIREEYVEILMDTICRSAPVCFFSAARPGQSGEGHYNEQSRAYWEAKFRARGFGIHPKNEVVMREIETHDAYKHCGWLIWNSMLMVKEK